MTHWHANEHKKCSEFGIMVVLLGDKECSTMRNVVKTRKIPQSQKVICASQTTLRHNEIKYSFHDLKLRRRISNTVKVKVVPVLN